MTPDELVEAVADIIARGGDCFTPASLKCTNKTCQCYDDARAAVRIVIEGTKAKCREQIESFKASDERTFDILLRIDAAERIEGALGSLSPKD